MKNFLIFFLRVYYSLKRLSLLVAKDSAIFTTTWLTANNNKVPAFWLFLKYILSWEIKAVKQYPLITKEVWIVLEAILKTRASCLIYYVKSRLYFSALIARVYKYSVTISISFFSLFSLFDIRFHKLPTNRKKCFVDVLEIKRKIS